MRVPRPHRLSAVFLEPLSVVEKAVLQAKRVLDRTEVSPGLDPNHPRKALVAGTGAIGMLAAMVLATEGFEVTAIDREGDKTAAGTLLSAIDAHHADVSPACRCWESSDSTLCWTRQARPPSTST